MNRLGVIVRLEKTGRSLAPVAGFGLDACQVSCWEPERYTNERAAVLAAEAQESGIEIACLWAGWPGPKAWNFTEGPATLGIVPRAYRAERVAALEQAGIFAAKAGLRAVTTHLGFIPEETGPLFDEVVATVRGLAEGYAAQGLEFWFETGQETPVTMRRLIETVGTGNLGVNLDPANLILYGKGNPVDALDVFGPWVRGVHVKDGRYPTDPMRLGTEMPVGQGRVDFAALIAGLTALGYQGAYVIEREISGPQQARDIAATIEYLRPLLAAAKSGE